MPGSGNGEWGTGASKGESKGEGEDAVRASKMDWTILRPSIIHGPDGEFMQMMKTFVCDAMVTSFGFLPAPFPVRARTG